MIKILKSALLDPARQNPGLHEICIKFNVNDIIKAVRNLIINKAYGHDDVTIHRRKICDSAIVEPLSLFIKILLLLLEFPNEPVWKNLIYKKNDLFCY